jgi:hypothetical protein
VPQEAAQTVAAANSGATAGATSWRNQIVAEALMVPLLMVGLLLIRSLQLYAARRKYS